MVNPDLMEWVPKSLCENTSIYSPKERVSELRDLVVMWEVIAVFWCSTQTVFTGVSRIVPGYEFIRMMIYTQVRTGKRVVVVHHFVTVAFLNPFFWVRNVGETLSARWRIPLLCESSRHFLQKLISPLWKMRVHLSSPFGVVDDILFLGIKKSGSTWKIFHLEPTSNNSPHVDRTSGNNLTPRGTDSTWRQQETVNRATTII